MVKRPSIWILCLFMLGIVCNKYICSVFDFIPIFFIISLICFLLFHYLKVKYAIQTDTFLLVLPIVFFLGFYLPDYNDQINHLSDSFLNCELYVKGTVKNVLEKASYQEIYLTDVRIQRDNKVSVLTELVVQEDSFVECLIGNHVLVKGIITEFDRATNPGQFDMKAYYKAKGICYRVWNGKIEKNEPSKIPMYKWIYNGKQSVSSTFNKALEKEDSEILHAMVLGEKSELTKEIKELYQKAGISHILAISGLHISMIGLFLFKLLKKMGLHHNFASIVCMVLVYLYGIMTGFSVSTNRAVVMMCLSLSACLVSRTYDSISAIAVSGLVILLQQPYQLFQSGFQLSFLAVFGAVWFYPVCRDYLNWLVPDYEKKMQRKEKSEYHSLGVFLNRVSRVFRSSLLASCCIQCLTLPVMLCSFYEVAVLAPILNLVIIPVSSILILLAVFIGIGGSIWLPIGKMLGLLVHGILVFYQVMCKKFAGIPGQVLLTGCPEKWQIVFFVFCVLLFVWHVQCKKKKEVGMLLLIGTVILCLNVPVNGLEVTVLDVGQGDGIVIQDRQGVTCMIDGGSTSVKGVGTYRILPFLKYSGIKELDYCFLTHMDEDHVNGIKEMIEISRKYGSVKINTLVLPSISMADEAYIEMVRLAKMTGIRVMYMERGQKIQTKDLSIKCLHPPYEFAVDDRNSASLVLELQYGSFRMLFTGDIDEIGEKSVLASGYFNGKEYDVLKVAHHGSKYSSCKEWLDATRPKMAIISCGKGNRYGHPHKELLDRLQKYKGEVRRTDVNGAICIKARR
ncbi:competence protein ComEC [[Clostridium] polysaccharolyticum]|uniref:Competence protein ComEC n=2 Tax=[Clostridium] polysaccharolyticum TaxID=29364 RepID=A0A1I0EK14_9FIRM|nr:competence protein ComEC [[Clostridium] polysaccharolyticum]